MHSCGRGRAGSSGLQSVELRRRTRSPDVSACRCGAQAWTVVRTGPPGCVATGPPRDCPPGRRPRSVGRRCRAAHPCGGADRGGQAARSERFVSVVGDPGAGEPRLLGELATCSQADRKMVTLWGRAGRVRAGDAPRRGDRLARRPPGGARRSSCVIRLGAATVSLLSTVFPALVLPLDAAAGPGGGRPRHGRTYGRYRLYRAMQAAPGGFCRAVRLGGDP